MALPALVAGREPAVQIALAQGLRSALRLLASGDARAREALQRLLVVFERDGGPLAGWVTEGLCLKHEFTLTRDVPEHLLCSLAVLDVVGPSQLAAARHGYSAQLGRLFARGIGEDARVVDAALPRLPADAWPDVARGLGWGATEADPAQAAPVIERVVPEAQRSLAWEGVGAVRRWIDGAAAPPASCPPAAREACARGAAWPAFPAPPWE